MLPSGNRPGAACWRPRSAVATVVLGLFAGQAAALALIASAGDGRGVLGASLVLGDLILLACVIAVANRGADRLGGATLGIRRTEWGPAIGWGAALLVSSIAVQGLLGAAFGAEGGGDSSTVRFSAGTAVLVTLGVAVTAPIAEEIAFRGYLFPALTRWRGPWMAATVTAVLFGAAHFAALPLALLPGAAFFGFGACLLFWFTGSLLPCVAVHSINNALVLAVVTGGQLAPAILLAPALALLVLMPFVRERAPTARAFQSTVSSPT
jgi:CAAX protease family protein